MMKTYKGAEVHVHRNSGNHVTEKDNGVISIYIDDHRVPVSEDKEREMTLLELLDRSFFTRDDGGLRDQRTGRLLPPEQQGGRAYFVERPKELFLHIARFRPLALTPHISRKLGDAIQATPDLDLPGACVLTGQGGKYSCTAVITHNGSTVNSGHYTMLRKINGKWYLFDDHRVTEKSDDYAAEAMKTAYILYYRLVS